MLSKVSIIILNFMIIHALISSSYGNFTGEYEEKSSHGTFTSHYEDNTFNSSTESNTGNMLLSFLNADFILNVKMSKPYKIARVLELYLVPVMAAFGLPGNILVMLVMTRKHNINVPCCWLMLMLAISDTVFGMTALYYYTKSVLLTHISWSSWECKVQLSIINFSSILSCYILVLLTINRYLAVCFPLKSIGFDVPRKTKICFFIVISFTLGFSLPIAYAIDHVPFLGCINFAKVGSFPRVYSILYIAFGSMVPFSVLLFLNISMIYKIRQRTANLAKLSETSQQESQSGDYTSHSAKPTSQLGVSNHDESTSYSIDSNHGDSNSHAGDSNSHAGDSDPHAGDSNHRHPKSHSKQITRMLLLVSLTFLILTLPQCLRYIVFSFVDYQQDAYTFSIFYLYFVISTRMYATNVAVNFYLYCISGTRFRNDVKKLFIKK